MIDGWAQAQTENDCYWLLNKIKAVTHQFDHTQFPYASLLHARSKLMNCCQQQHESPTNNIYINNITGWAEVHEAYGGNLNETPLDKNSFLTDASVTSPEEHRNGTLATLAILNAADNTRYLALRDELSNAYLKGTDDYPLDLTSMH